MAPKHGMPFILVMIAALTLPLLASCVPTTTAPVTVKETVIVKEVVKETVEVPQAAIKETVVVQEIVTPTPVPPPVKKSGPVYIGTGGMTGKHLNPIWMTSNPQFMTFPLILPALTWFDNQVQPVADLATEIEVNEAATLYTFHLPENATWSDGTPLTSKDVIFTYNLAVAPNVGQSVWAKNFASIMGLEEYQAGTATGIAGITAIDEHTVQFELKESNAAFLYNTYLGILPEHVLGQVKTEELEMDPYLDAPTVTSGPYEFVKYEPGQYIQLKKRADYWGKQVTIDEVYIKLFESTATQLAQLEAGELDVAVLPAEEVERFRSLAHIDVLSVKGIGYLVTHLDFRNAEQIAALNIPKDQGGKGYSITKEPRPYMLDKRFRQALDYAIDKDAVIQVVAGGEATPIGSPIFGPDWAVNPDLNPYDRDLEKSKALLQEVGVTFTDAGVAQWEGKPITLVYLSDTSEASRQLGEVIQQQLKDVGIRLDLKLVTSSAFLQAAIDGEADLIRNAGGRFGADPSVSALYYTCKAGWSELVIGYCNPKFDELMQAGAASSIQEERQKAYWEASALLNEELPSLFFYTPNVFFGANKGLKGLSPTADPGYLTWNIEEWYRE